jgi:hypothetical protein
MSDIETARSVPGFNHVVRLAHALGSKPSELVARAEEIERKEQANTGRDRSR